MPADAGPGLGNPFGTVYHNPLTLSVFFVLIGYYVCYFGYVLWQFKQGRHARLAPAGADVNPASQDRNKPQANAS